jgi:hypothetical protein
MRPALSEATIEQLDHALAATPDHKGRPADDVERDATDAPEDEDIERVPAGNEDDPAAVAIHSGK